MRLEAVHCAEDHKEGCPTCGGVVQRRPYGEMYAGSFVLDGERVEIRREPNPEYRDPVYLDEITQYFNGALYRMWPGEKYLAKGGSRIHRDVWVSAFGPIPRGCHIHHKDGNPVNNRLDNLECVEASEHLSLTWRESRGSVPAEKHFSTVARAKAAEWHKSDEGRLWHKRQAERSQSWTKWKREERACECCGVLFMGVVRKSGNAGKYCSPVCKTAAYRARGAQTEWARNYRQRKASEPKG